MGEGILRARLSPRSAEFATVSSAGTSAAPGLKASAHSVTVCRDNGIDIASHRSRAVSRQMIRNSDLILVMERHHRDAILGVIPDAVGKTFVLPNYADESRNEDVPDPIGQDLGTYRDIFQRIDSYITQALPRIEASIAEAGKSV